jgi:riboflavin biosynthesis pyrimidine reductase
MTFVSLDGVVQAPGGRPRGRRRAARAGARSLLVMGSPGLAGQLVDADLVDEYRLMIEPILLGGGKSIFPCSGAARPLTLVSTTTAATVVLLCTYRRACGALRAPAPRRARSRR